MHGNNFIPQCYNMNNDTFIFWVIFQEQKWLITAQA